MEIYELLKIFRDKNGISQSYIAKKMGISINKISKVELGKTSLTVGFLEKYCDICNVDIVKLFKIKNYKNLNVDQKVDAYYSDYEHM